MSVSAKTATGITAALQKEDIVGDLFPARATSSTFIPEGSLLVDYSTPNTTVSLGNVLPTETTQDAPTFFYKPFDNVDTSSLYTLVMTDPDAPSRTDKKFSEYCHYVVTDIKFTNANEGGAIVPGQDNVELHSYIGPGPPKGTGLHRYIFLLLKQDSSVKNFSEVKERFNWGYGVPGVGIERWGNENNLKLIAANYFLAENK
ncbi:similar to Saccharomyces cerevisiae YLR179C Protein of unknown function with similarity to Tfs1p [Maudiozyma barnettii]|uniref:Phosphatidylethanolamine-binding protein n=1 Tax=Maudiozyma barnettii TaxID=61262 RepID=A0A8H2ZFJ9_9SACH|nr:uncharacterized protein KABA2_02S16654 [Kazachstania barnettii]CAB4253316.1 similar to Saccharomyces cerevisiae YLR179C Protein of unknown function with similarity to Tfs1p [Kazachstania barnettii]CAD1780824.1 similar to Saccharomyces cerevisiae YLR179C Protein of unknown function with similarity to Tfs1p [Kazachstania barnettii]